MLATIDWPSATAHSVAMISPRPVAAVMIAIGAPTAPPDT
jgi:hypothetical protein